MKATGIVRRIDDLGRIVIPKEIRRTLFIREGDPLEIYVGGEGDIIFKKYSPVKELGKVGGDIVCGVAKACSSGAAVFDKDELVSFCSLPSSVSGGKMSKKLSDICLQRKPVLCGGESIPLIDGGDILVDACCPIIANGDVIGCVASAGGEGSVGDGVLKAVSVASYFLGNRLSD